MILLEDLVAGQRVRGLAVSGPVTVEVDNRHGPDTVSVIFTESTGGVGRELLSRADQERLFVETIGLLPPLDADANEFKLAATEWDMIIFDEALGYNRGFDLLSRRMYDEAVSRLGLRCQFAYRGPLLDHFCDLIPRSLLHEAPLEEEQNRSRLLPCGSLGRVPRDVSVQCDDDVPFIFWKPAEPFDVLRGEEANIFEMFD